MIYAGIATIPSREYLIPAVINSISPQVDKLFIALNGYTEVPQSLSKIYNAECILLDNSLGDAAKFYHVADCNGYYFSIDDDLVYPQGCVSYMISKISQYNSIVTLHGRRYKRPVTSFRRGFDLNYHCLHSYDYDTELDAGGTGVMAFDTKRFKLSVDDFKLPNMADVWAAKKAHEQGVKIMGVAHRNDYLRYLSPLDTIWHNSKDDTQQTRILREFLK